MPTNFESFGERAPSWPVVQTQAQEQELPTVEMPTADPVLEAPADGAIEEKVTVLPAQKAPAQKQFQRRPRGGSARITTGRPVPGTPRLKH